MKSASIRENPRLKIAFLAFVTLVVLCVIVAATSTKAQQTPSQEQTAIWTSERALSPQERAERGSYVGCIAGALSRREYLDGLAAAGFTGAEVAYTHEAAPGMHAAIIRAHKGR